MVRLPILGTPTPSHPLPPMVQVFRDRPTPRPQLNLSSAGGLRVEGKYPPTGKRSAFGHPISTLRSTPLVPTVASTSHRISGSSLPPSSASPRCRRRPPGTVLPPGAPRTQPPPPLQCLNATNFQNHSLLASPQNPTSVFSMILSSCVHDKRDFEHSGKLAYLFVSA